MSYILVWEKNPFAPCHISLEKISLVQQVDEMFAETLSVQDGGCHPLKVMTEPIGNATILPQSTPAVHGLVSDHIKLSFGWIFPCEQSGVLLPLKKTIFFMWVELLPMNFEPCRWKVTGTPHGTRIYWIVSQWTPSYQ